MRPLLTPSQRVASALRRTEKALRSWQDDPDSPRHDVDKMLTVISDLRVWVQGHVLADIERAERLLRSRPPTEPPTSLPPPPPES
ncbi:MAG TPA: hypothetical protein VFA07_01915 [Chthonomonadaceae bacterium]|nr:hypothetical protein [Chthonomonadaceae bacterium]